MRDPYFGFELIWKGTRMSAVVETMRRKKPILEKINAQVRFIK